MKSIYQQQMDKIDRDFYLQLGSILFVMLFFMALVVWSVVKADKEHKKMLEDRGCTLTEKVDTHENRYCGKACYHRIYEYHYNCRDGLLFERK